jgi:ribonuclease J
MSKIKVFALGGLGENGKNLYCVDVDNSLFVLDCGIKYPNSELLGIDTVLPDFSFLIENSDRIKGLFLSHAHDDHIGAVKNLLEKIKVKVYGTNFTLDVVKDSLSEELLSQTEKLFHVVTPEDVIKFKNVKISFFATAHSIPETIGINIHTEDGVIVYTGNYTFDQNQDSNYGISYSKLMDLVNKKVLLLMSESLGANKFGNSTNYVEMMYKLKLIFSRAKGRLIFTVFSQDLRRIQKLIDLAVEYDKKVAIVGRKTQRLINGEPAKYTDPIIMVGASECYEARCRKCHTVIK